MEVRSLPGADAFGLLAGREGAPIYITADQKLPLGMCSQDMIIVTTGLTRHNKFRFHFFNFTNRGGADILQRVQFYGRIADSDENLSCDSLYVSFNGVDSQYDGVSHKEIEIIRLKLKHIDRSAVRPVKKRAKADE
jgi:hypothetical protein